MIHVVNKYFYVLRKLPLVMAGVLLGFSSVYAQSATENVAGTVSVSNELTLSDLKQAADYALQSFRVNLQHGADVTADYLTKILGQSAIVFGSQAARNQAVKSVDSAIVSGYMQTDSTQQAGTQVPQVLDTVQQVLDYWVYPIDNQAAYPAEVNTAHQVSGFPYGAVPSSGSLMQLVKGYRQLLYYQQRVDNCVSTLNNAAQSTSSGQNSTNTSTPAQVTSLLDQPCDKTIALDIITGSGGLAGGGASLQSLLSTLARQSDSSTPANMTQEEAQAFSALSALHENLSDFNDWISGSGINLHNGRFQTLVAAVSSMDQVQSKLNSLLPGYEKYLLQAIYVTLLKNDASLAYPSLSTLLQLDSYATDEKFDCSNVSSSSTPTNVRSIAQQFAQEYLFSLSTNSQAPKGVPRIPVGVDGEQVFIRGGTYFSGPKMRRGGKASAKDLTEVKNMASNRAMLAPQIKQAQQNYARQLKQYMASQGLAMDNLFQLYEQRVLNYAGPGKSCTPMQLKRHSAEWRNGSETVDGEYTWNQSMQMASPDVVQRQSLYLLAEIRQELFEMNQVNHRVLATLSAMELAHTQDALSQLSSVRSNLEQDIKAYVAGKSPQESLAAKGAQAVSTSQGIQNLGKGAEGTS